MSTSREMIEYDFYHSRFGEVLIARSSESLCHLEFVGRNRGMAIRRLATDHPNASLRERSGKLAGPASAAFSPNNIDRPRMHLQGTDFQIAVWETLLEIPVGATVSYQWVAERVERPRAVRAVANAIASNRMAYLVPCHRVIRSDGALGGYRWGVCLKSAMLEWEKAEFQAQTSRH